MDNVWQQEKHVFTPGGEVLFFCPKCKEDRHLFGVENPENYHHICKKNAEQLIKKT